MMICQVFSTGTRSKIYQRCPLIWQRTPMQHQIIKMNLWKRLDRRISALISVNYSKRSNQTYSKEELENHKSAAKPTEDREAK
jgi:hypothetical protein